MPGLVAVLKELVNDIVTFLRYFGAPAVAVVVAWVADWDHTIIQGSTSGFPMLNVAGVPISFWALVPFLALVGVAVYTTHRSVFMPFVGKLIHRRTNGSAQPTLDDLSFARWRRRAAPADSPARVAQSFLDQANAAVDFLYCSGWTTVTLSVLLWSFFPGQLNLGKGRAAAIATIAAILLVAGYFAHRNTAHLDRLAFLEFPPSRGEQG